MKGGNFVKKLSMTKKKVVRNFGENRRELFQDFLSENKFAQNFCPPIFVTQIFAPPIFMTSLRRCTEIALISNQHYFHSFPLTRILLLLSKVDLTMSLRSA